MLGGKCLIIWYDITSAPVALFAFLTLAIIGCYDLIYTEGNVERGGVVWGWGAESIVLCLSVLLYFIR